jgi:excisionase family DNA binding protein
MPEKRFIGIEEYAEYLDIKKGTLYQWVHERRIPRLKLGKGLLKE